MLPTGWRLFIKPLESHAGCLLLDHTDSKIGVLPDPIDTLRYMPTAVILGRLELALFKSSNDTIRFVYRFGFGKISILADPIETMRFRPMGQI
jgi:hypothetical protein